MTEQTQTHFYTSASTALAAFLLFALALPHGITGGDAGELTTAAYFLGIPHPPGYPTWCLLAHPFTWIPAGSIALRVALSSAVFGALTAGVVSLIVIELTGTAWAGVVAGLLLATSPFFYEQAIIAEVYTLDALCFSTCVYLLLRWSRQSPDWRDTLDRQSPDWRESANPRTNTNAPDSPTKASVPTSPPTRHLYALALLTGLGQGVHNTMTLLAPVFALYVAWRNPALLRQPVQLAKYIAVFLLGCCVYLYLPLRSLANPPIDWGNPETLHNFVAHVRRDQFAFMYSQYPRGLGRFMDQLWEAGKFLILYGIPFVLPGVLALASVAFFLWKHPRAALLILLTGLWPVVAITWAQNPLRTAEWNDVMFPFYIPGVWCLVIALGAWLGSNFGSLGIRGLAAGVCMACSVLVMVSGTLWRHAVPHSEPYWVSAYARNLLNQLPPSAILFAGPDHAAFPILYLQTVEHERQDVTLGNPYGYVDTALVANAPQSLRDELGDRPRRGLDTKYYSWLLTHTDRPVYFNQPPTLEEGTPIVFRQEGLLYRALAAEGAPDTSPAWPEYTWPESDFGMRDSYAPGYVAHQIVAEYQYKRLAYEYAKGVPEYLEMRVQNLKGVAWNDPEYLNNTAILLARHGEYRLAKELLEQAVKCDPDNATVRANLEKLGAK